MDETRAKSKLSIETLLFNAIKMSNLPDFYISVAALTVNLDTHSVHLFFRKLVFLSHSCILFTNCIYLNFPS